MDKVEQKDSDSEDNPRLKTPEKVKRSRNEGSVKLSHKKQKFRNEWIQKIEFKNWLVPVQNDNYKGFAADGCSSKMVQWNSVSSQVDSKSFTQEYLSKSAYATVYICALVLPVKHYQGNAKTSVVIFTTILSQAANECRNFESFKSFENLNHTEYLNHHKHGGCHWQWYFSFAVHETLKPYIRQFNPVSERLAVLRIGTKPLNIVLVCTHAPTDTSDEDIKDAFYEELAHTYDNISGNVIKLVLGDLNAKCGRAAAAFCSDGITANQIDHILIQKRFRSCVKDIRSYRRADCDTVHFLVVAKFEIKLKCRKQLEKVNSIKIDLERLNDEEIQQKYSKSIGEYVKGIELNEIDEDWDKVSKVIKEVAAKDIGKTRNKKKKWYNENCRQAIRKRQTARENYTKEDSTDRKRIYILERKMCKRVLQREKRKYLSDILQEAERNCSIGNVRNFFKTIKQYKTFNSSLKTFKNRHGEVLMNPKEKAERWKEYFTELLNADIPDNATRRENLHGPELMTIKTAQALEQAASKVGAMLSAKNDWSKEIGVRIAKAERAAFALNKFLKSKLFSKKTKTRLYTAIIRPTLTYGCEAWTTTSITERRLRTSENRIWRTICGPIYDSVNLTWRKKNNKELQDELGIASVISFIRGQRIQWLGYAMRRSEDDISRTILNWKPMGKRPRGRPRKRWLDVVEEDQERLRVQEWREVVQDREKWMAAKTLREYQKKK
ncbi:hypothetical protein AGLY_016470 [Aphis glycines]|uniref:Endonuclease/exonuclease/phosphatase domain-containing protein n=1 Tax=Aphis glycines TaxID=307491 RepID=A0A6G0SXS8_APHGL|nr:hypothetical protein AGLY_016470 [Aphis glycines]